MSKIFYDHLLDFGELEKEIKRNVKSREEREEIYRPIDEIVHHRVLGCVLDRLPHHCHREFLDEFSKKPYDLSLLNYLRKHIVDDIEEFIREEIRHLSVELLELFADREEIEKLPSKK